MSIASNPFNFREVPVDAPFCDREKELEDLVGYARGRASVVLFSPRRYGKTSLVRRVQKTLGDEGAVTVYADFFGVTSVEEAASRFAKSVFAVIHGREKLWDAAVRIITSFRPVVRYDERGGLSLGVEPAVARKAGEDLLDETFASFGKFVAETGGNVHVALDEFQEIADLKGSPRIEGILRAHIQQQRCSYFFVGSRRRILLAMFNDRRRPFYQSAINVELGPLPREDLARFVVERFREGGKGCDLESAREIVALVQAHPYYAQKLAFFVFETAAERVKPGDVRDGMEKLLQAERPVYEAILQGLSTGQISLLKALAKEPGGSILSVEYMGRHRLGSVGGVQGARKKLLALDLIEEEKSAPRRLSVVDPMFALWLARE